MRRRDFITSSLAALAAASAIAGAAEAGMKAGPNMAGPGHHRLKTPSGGGALDGFTQPFGAYSFRKLLSSYSGPAIRIRRASDNQETDIGFLGFVPGLESPLDVAAANAHCASTSCFVRTVYDQSGNGRDLVQTTAGMQPPFSASCINSLPCLKLTGTETIGAVAAIAPATGVVSISAVARRPSGTGICTFRQNGNNNRVIVNTVAGQWQVLNIGAITVTAADGVAHAAQGVISGASSILRIDGAETAGTVTGNTVAGGAQLTGALCDDAEFVIWDNYALTPAERAALGNNQKSFWGTP